MLYAVDLTITNGALFKETEKARTCFVFFISCMVLFMG